MIKKKPPSQGETLKHPTIPRNTMVRRDEQDSGFITGWLNNRKRGAPLKISKQTTTIKTNKGKKTTAYLSVAAMVSPVTAPAAVASATTTVNTASTDGEATAPPSNSKRPQKHSGGCFEKCSCYLLKASTQNDYTQEQIQQLKG